jgi:hypothetical protein
MIEPADSTPLVLVKSTLRPLLIGLAVVSILGPEPAEAQAPARGREDEPVWGVVQLAPFAGLQFGGSVTTASGRHADFDAGLDYGATLDIDLTGSWRIELLYSRQGTELPGPFEATVERLMAGVVEERGDGPTRFFGVALLGATRFVPGFSGFDSDALFTIGLGLGVKHLFTDHLGVRAEARGFYAITESGGGLFCSGGCLFVFSSSGLWQGDVSAGIVLGF